MPEVIPEVIPVGTAHADLDKLEVADIDNPEFIVTVSYEKLPTIRLLKINYTVPGKKPYVKYPADVEFEVLKVLNFPASFYITKFRGEETYTTAIRNPNSLGILIRKLK